MTYLINVFLSSIELATGIVLSLTMFRFQIYYYLHKIYGIALLMSAASFYFRDVVEINSLSILSAISIQVTLILIIYRIPFFYSSLVSVTGYMAGAIIETVFMLIGIKINLFTEYQIQNSYITLGIVQLSTALIILLIVFLLQRRKIGFLFKKKHLASKTAIKGYNFFLSAILIACVVLIQFELDSYYNNSLSLIITLSIAIVFWMGIIIAYKHNKKIIRDTYERPVKDELDRVLRNENSTNNS